MRVKAAVSIVGGAGLFPNELAEPISRLFRQIARPLVERHGAMLIDGGTAAGIMKLLGDAVHPHAPSDRRTSSVEPPLLVGFAPEPLVSYPGATRDLPDMVDLDPNHPYHVLVHDAREWGGEVEAMLGVLDHLQRVAGLPTLGLLINGGRIALMEAHQGVSRGRPLIVLGGTGRAADLILAARDGRPPAELRALLSESRISTRPDDQDEALARIKGIADHPRLIAFDVKARPPDELREILVDLLRPRPDRLACPADMATAAEGAP